MIYQPLSGPCISYIELLEALGNDEGGGSDDFSAMAM